jgi:hypothetical protein
VREKKQDMLSSRSVASPRREPLDELSDVCAAVVDTSLQTGYYVFDHDKRECDDYWPSTTRPRHSLAVVPRFGPSEGSGTYASHASCCANSDGIQ